MATNDQTSTITLTDGALDPNVRVPDHVKQASSAADQLHERFYPKDLAQVAAPAKEAVPQPDQATADAAAAEVTRAAEAQRAADEAAAQLADPQTRAPAADKTVSEDGWQQRFLSMQGRYNASQKTLGSMEEQMRQLGQELIRTQQVLASVQSNAPQMRNPDTNHEKLITAEDRSNYGDELIDLTQRVARATVAPELDALRAKNEDLTRQVRSSSKRELFVELDRALPTWRDINKSTQFKTWLALPNVYTRQVRQAMLTDAVNGANAPLVLQFFNDFLRDAKIPAAQAQSAPLSDQPNPAPRVPALQLEALAAPGRPRPNAGDTQVPGEKPIITRAQISQFYSDSRKGLYAGRETEYRAAEAELQRAQAEGRVR
jgi:hypothetical protein